LNANKLLSLVALATALSTAHTTQASESVTSYPSQVVKIVVPYTPGGITDLLGRALASRLEKKWGQSVVVENKSGGSEAIGAAYVAKSKPDGYTIFIASDAAFIVNPLLKKSLNYNPEMDFEPIMRLAEGLAFLVVRPDLNIRSLKDLLAQAQARPGQVTFGSEAVGSPSEFRMRLLGGLTGGYKMNHIPYNGMVPIISDMLGGRVDSAWLPPHLARPQIEAKTLLPLATNGTKRNWIFPEVPTLTELGFDQADLSFKMMLVAPAGTPKPIVDKIARDVLEVMQTPDFNEKYVRFNGYTGIASSPQEFQDYLVKTRPFLKQVVKDAGFEPQ
jgi:tripartite-type tricarboxylate transporter receptor subunit TctC